MGIDLSFIWAVIILFGIMMYVIMDGFDLGIGLLYPFFPEKADRDVMMNTVAPVWDGNETWLVLGGAGLLAAFPLAYAVVLSALYLPLIFMLIGLIFRGVAFEFRFKAREHERHFWDKAFAGGSLVATFFQGMALGTYLRGIPVANRAYAGGPLDWISPFSVFTGIALVIAFTLLGSTWLIMKTEGELQERAYRITRRMSWLLLAVIAVISIWTPLATVLQQRAVAQRAQATPFIYTLALVFLCYSGLGISIWPNIIPPSVTIWEAASPPQSQSFTLVGALLIIPMILAYTVWAYYVFRGKVRHDDGYH